jgi:4-hydroxy-3-polyprenylbenzoate decarboxylase
MNAPLRIIVGISGASGTAFGVSVLRALSAAHMETHLILSKAAALSLQAEMDMSIDEVQALASVVHKPGDIGASIASGSFRTEGMIIAPCSIKTMGEIASSNTGTLMSRAADVCLKERRRLVLMVRETPLNLLHLRAMTALTEAGAIIAPPVPSLYTRPVNIDEMIDQTTARALSLFGIDIPHKQWGEDIGPTQ